MSFFLFIRTDLEKFSLISLANQWVLCSEWVPSGWESKQQIQTYNYPKHNCCQSFNVLKLKSAHLRETNKCSCQIKFSSVNNVYCNSLYLGINSSSISGLQMVQNVAACLLTGVRKYEPNPVLMSLHWLPVRFRNYFKVLLLVFKCLNGLAAPYLSDVLCEYHPERTLRSANQSLLTVPNLGVIKILP